MFEYWRDQYLNRGVVAGGMFVKGNFCYVPIPKNSSSYIGNLLVRNSWNSVNFLTMSFPNEKIIVLLREPTDRWLSGMTQYLCSYLLIEGRTVDDIIKNWNSLLTDIVFDKVVFDDHTECQNYFLRGLPKDQCVFFDSSNHPELAIRDYLKSYNTELIIDHPSLLDIDRNISTVEDGRAQLALFLKSMIDKDNRLAERLKYVYREDYKLWNNINK